ncbi:MAG: malto-oligosyltrehalose trehalohydrolase [Pirellulaceae bacterium]|nr:malto-oligosyltrehalose trehalohydrolase [Pirellulaceae bacterium]
MSKAAHPTYPPTLGARYLGENRCQFRVWAPRAQSLAVHLLDPAPRVVQIRQDHRGYYEQQVDDVPPGTRYFYRLDGKTDRPDPASHWQPAGVHQASAVLDPAFPWTDQHWSGLALHEYITYELHIGTFTPQGTFEAAIQWLDELVELGITAIEIMPVAQFPGDRNWGYDGVHPFATQNSYGGPPGLKRLVDACHARGLAVVLDVVYNHLGPEGNYLGEFGPYFTERYRTPWGQALNYDGRGSDEVRRFFIENALYWIEQFHIDALRLDAVHAIFDYSAFPFLAELAEAVRLEGERLGRRVHTIAESSLNAPWLVEPREAGGWGIDAQWVDDLHHSLRTALVGQQSGYYEDFQGVTDLAKAYRDGFVQDGRYSAYRGRRHGAPARHVAPARFVVCAQNHDQVGNRMLGERLPELVNFEQLKLAAAAVILSPYQPLLFMGEEYAEPAPFQYFISHLDPELVAAVRRGRREEFARFRWQQEPPDPQAEETFQRSKLNHALRREGRHGTLRAFYRELIRLRRGESALATCERGRLRVDELDPGRALGLLRSSLESDVYVVLNFDSEPVETVLPLPAGPWTRKLDSADPRWLGGGSELPEVIRSIGRVACRLAPQSAAVYVQSHTGEDAAEHARRIAHGVHDG